MAVTGRPFLAQTDGHSGVVQVVPLEVRQRRIVWLAFIVGGLLRLVYLFALRPAPAAVFSDMEYYVIAAGKRAAGIPEAVGDTLFPPGYPWLLGVLLRLDHTWTLAVTVQWLLSVAMLGLVFSVTRRTYGNSPSIVALIIAAIYLPYFHYASLFLAETAFSFFVLGTIWLFQLAVSSDSRAAAVRLGCAAGLAAGISTAFKNTMVAGFVIILVVLLAYAARHRRKNALLLATVAVLGFSAALTPLSVRCTILNNGSFCPGANNLGMNILEGHSGRTRVFIWRTPNSRTGEFFGTVEGEYRNYHNVVPLDFPVYENSKNIGLAMRWIRANPVRAIYYSVRNVYAMFIEKTLWPRMIWRGADMGIVSQVFFWCVVLLPALVQIRRRLRAMSSLDFSAMSEWLLVAPVLGVMISVFISITEVRFRVPFDGFLITLAAPVWCAFGTTLLVRVCEKRVRTDLSPAAEEAVPAGYLLDTCADFTGRPEPEARTARRRGHRVPSAPGATRCRRSSRPA